MTDTYTAPFKNVWYATPHMVNSTFGGQNDDASLTLEKPEKN